MPKAPLQSRHYRCDLHRPDPDRPAGKDGFLAQCRVVWNPADGGNIRFYVSADEFTDEFGEKPGMWLTFSSNVKSANYDPGYFNRAARWLKMHGLPAPALVPIKSRKLADRIVALLK
jgi:hypothetical protein